MRLRVNWGCFTHADVALWLAVATVRTLFGECIHGELVVGLYIEHQKPEGLI
jgi:hypothetical protein